MTAENTLPTRRENREELRRILFSHTFENASKLVPFLERLVEDGLAGKPVDEHTLGIEIFNKPKEWVPLQEATVRESLRNLRKRLDQYYDEEGGEDPVIIAFPKRQGYSPTFRYNEASATVEHYRRGVESFNRTFPEIAAHASTPVIQEFEASIQANRSYAPPYAALAEVLLLYCICDEPHHFSPFPTLARAEVAATTALTLDDQLWLAHIVLGAIHCCRFQWNEATTRFDSALVIAPEETRSNFWYVAFLVAVARIEEANICLHNLVNNHPESRFTPILVALFLYVTRDFMQAYEFLKLNCEDWDFYGHWQKYSTAPEIPQMDNWLVELLHGCLCLSLEFPCWADARNAAEHSKVGLLRGICG